MGETPVSAGGGPRARRLVFRLGNILASDDDRRLCRTRRRPSSSESMPVRGRAAAHLRWQIPIPNRPAGGIAPDPESFPRTQPLSTVASSLGWLGEQNVALRSVRALGPQDLELPQMTDAARLPLGLSQAFGVLFTYLLRQPLATDRAGLADEGNVDQLARRRVRRRGWRRTSRDGRPPHGPSAVRPTPLLAYQ